MRYHNTKSANAFSCFIDFIFRGFLLSLLSQGAYVYAQLPPLQPPQDCMGAIPLCQEVFVQRNIFQGTGRRTTEVNPSFSCGEGEINSVWYTFQIASDGDLCFSLIPIQNGDNFNWSLYDLTGRGCEAISEDPRLEVACNNAGSNASNGCTGLTGMNGQTLGPCGNQNRGCLSVRRGQLFALLVTHGPEVNAGYRLDFSASTADMVDQVQPRITQVNAQCQDIQVTFSEPVLCTTVSADDFLLLGPGGPFRIVDVQDRNCSLDGRERTFTFVLSPPIAQAGDYSFALVGEVEDACGNISLPGSFQVNLIPAPTASISPIEPQCLGGDAFTLAYNGTIAPTTYEWDLGDGTLARDSLFRHSYASPGVKRVRLVVGNDAGCTDTTFQELRVFPRPEINFSLPNAPCSGDSIRLVNLSVVDTPSLITTYLWDLGNGLTSAETSPTLSYQEGGLYSLSLTATTDQNCSSTLRKNLKIEPVPVANFSLPPTGCVGTPVTFANTSSFPKGVSGSAIPTSSLSWEFGDGGSATGQERPSYTFNTPGTYTVNLSIASNQGCEDTISKTLEIIQPAPPEVEGDTVCQGNASVLQVELAPGQTAFWFDAPGADNPLTLGRRFTTAPLETSTTYYVYTVSAEGCESEMVAVDAVVFPPGTAQISVVDTLLQLPAIPLTFSLAGTVEPESVFWDFGDGQTSEEFLPVHQYIREGTFLVQAEVRDEVGCEYQLTQRIKVTKPVTILLPTAFSPNGDGINDQMRMEHSLLAGFRIKIFNRFGQSVFDSNSPDFVWDGMGPDGKPVPEGVYTYRYIGVDVTNTRYEELGTITVIR